MFDTWSTFESGKNNDFFWQLVSTAMLFEKFHAGTRNSLLAMVVEMMQNSTFQNCLHIQHLFIHIQHLYVFSINIYSRSTFIFRQNSTPKFIFNSYICSQNYYLFRNFLSIQHFFIHSRFTTRLSYACK